MRLVVYTAVFGNYDAIRAPGLCLPDVDYVCFADNAAQVPAGWTHRDLPGEAASLSPASRNRWAKMHPDRLFPAHDVSVYVDGNIAVIGDVSELARSAVAAGPLSMYEHPFRKCLYDEAIACARIGLLWLDPIRRHLERYATEGFPRNAGLYEANVIIRQQHDPHVIRAMTRWWSEWQNGIKRDQLSLTYALWREGLLVNSLGRHDPRFIHRYFMYLRHRHPLRGLPVRLLRRYLNRGRLLIEGDLVPAIKQQAPTG